MHWNYRIVDMSAENGGEPWFELREVFYEEDGSLQGHTSATVSAESPESLVRVLQRMIDDVKLAPTAVVFQEVE